MRILTWNINGVRTLPQYHPWNTFKTFDEILNHLQADVICFQEVKSSRQDLPTQVAIPASYNSFFSFPAKKTGYSGVSTYCRKSVVVPLKAEEGLTGLILPRTPLSDGERISLPSTYPPSTVDLSTDFKELDNEGRAILVDLGLFVLINVYCPNDGTGSEEREKFKMDYHRLLETRVRGLIQDGREVMVVGDLNACAAVEDHCEGQLMVARGLVEGLQGEEGFWGKDCRRWIRDLLMKDDGTCGSMVDIVRKFWPNRKAMYTCWNTKIAARETNYGTRIDFILVTPGLVPWIQAADIQPHIRGSDHCPVYVDLRDEIVNADGSITKLREVWGIQHADGTVAPPEPPRLAAKFWEEHRQKLLSTFFAKKSDDAHAFPTPLKPRRNSMGSPGSLSKSNTGKRKLVSDYNPPASPVKKIKDSLTRLQKASLKTKEKREVKPSQSTIASFFSQPKHLEPSKLLSPYPFPKWQDEAKATDSIGSSTPSVPDTDTDADYELALLLSQSDDIQPSSTAKASGSQDKDETKQAWSTLLAQTQIPKCLVHGEPAKELTVNKPGPNKGKRFFLCSRPVGPGYDKGRVERLREQVDTKYKCNFFKWSSDARREMARNS